MFLQITDEEGNKCLINSEQIISIYNGENGNATINTSINGEGNVNQIRSQTSYDILIKHLQVIVV